MTRSILLAFAFIVSVVAAGPALAQQSSSMTGLAGLRPVAQPQVLTLQEAFRMAGERSTDLRIAALKVDESKAQLTKAWALVLPNISLADPAEFVKVAGYPTACGFPHRSPS